MKSIAQNKRYLPHEISTKVQSVNAISPEMLEFEKLLAEKPDAAKSLIALLKTV